MKSEHSIGAALDDREVAICRRFREARLRAKWRMPDFARALEIPRDRLASYEYARSPIRYALAKRMCDRFNINQRWLATGRLPSRHYVDIHAFVESQIPDKMLFSEAYEAFLSGPIDNEITRVAKSLCCTEQEIEDNWQRIGISGPVGSPGLKLSELYHERLLALRLQQMPEGIEKKIYQQLNAVLDQSLPGGVLGRNFKGSAAKRDLANRSQQGISCGKLSVDKAPASGTVPGMSSEIPTWKQLVSALARLTKSPGAKAQLAKDLRTSRQNVNKWLSGAGAPSAELTLDVFRWVETHGGRKLK